MKFAYERVSARKQSRDGNGLQEQIEKLKAEGYHELIVEEFSDSTTKSPKLDSLIHRLNIGDSLIVTKLDRITRSTFDGSALINDLLNRGVAVHILIWDALTILHRQAHHQHFARLCRIRTRYDYRTHSNR